MFEQNRQMDRIAKDAHRIDIMEKGREIVMKERIESQGELSKQKQVVAAMTEEFRRFGTLHKSKTKP